MLGGEGEMGTLIADFAITYRVHRHRDECGDVIVPGRFGHIYTFSETRLGMLFAPPGNRAVLWCNAQKRLLAGKFTVVQDGDREGAVTFDPANVGQCRLAIKTALIKVRRLLTPEDAKRRKEQMEGLNRIRRNKSKV